MLRATWWIVLGYAHGVRSRRRSRRRSRATANGNRESGVGIGNRESSATHHAHVLAIACAPASSRPETSSLAVVFARSDFFEPDVSPAELRYEYSLDFDGGRLTGASGLPRS